MTKNSIPFIIDSKKVCIICEGNEEYAYFNRLKELGVWDKQYSFDLINAEGNGNVAPRYQDKYHNGSYDVVLVFCDTDRKPYEQYQDIKSKIDKFHGISGVSNEVVIFGNPCTLQIIIQHWEDVILTTQSKKKNAPLIEKHTGIKNYDAHKDQIETLVSFINAQNYDLMCKRISALSVNDKDVGSTNILRFLNNFSSGSSLWIDEINSKLDSEC